jgi:cytoskeletal protein CcmA (bactofilin family)
MFSSGTNETVIAEGLKIEGKVAADGLIRVHGTILGDLHCTSLIISDKAQVTGTVVADTVVVDGTVEGPIRGSDVTLKFQAHVTGDIHHTSLAIEKGARFDGRSKQVNGTVAEKADGRVKKLPSRKITQDNAEQAPAA